MLWFSFSHTLSHLADILSFTDKSNIPSQLAMEVVKLCSQWIQSVSKDYDVLFGPILTPKWVREHQPVLSRKGHGHVLYTNATTAKPDGKLVVCHMSCKAVLNIHSGKENVRITCTNCESTTFVLLIIPDRSGILGCNKLVKTPFPQEQYKATWKHHNPNKPRKFQLPPTPKLPVPELPTPMLLTVRTTLPN